MTDNKSISKVQQAIKELKQGKLIILTDDSNREHEGDLVGLGAFVTMDTINFALKYARGILAVPMSKRRSIELGLSQMVENNTEKFGTKFTVSVDHINSTTGVSALERANTIKNLANLSSKSSEFESPGHIFPLVAEEKGVLKRPGHTEGAVDLAMLAGVPPISYIIEILSADGSMAREKELNEFAKQHNLLQLSIQDIISFKQSMEENKVILGSKVQLPTKYGDFTVTEFINESGQPTLLFESKTVPNNIPLVRLHSECLTGDVFGSLRCECGPQLEAALKLIAKEGGVLLYLRQEGRNIGLHEKLKSYVLQENGYDTFDANLVLGHQPDERDYQQASNILKFIGMSEIRLLTNNPDKVQSILDNSIKVVERVPLIVGINEINEHYMSTKKEKFEHLL